MKIGIDARCLEVPVRGGVARILKNLFMIWPKKSSKIRYVLYWENVVPDDDFLKHQNFEHVVLNVPSLLRRPRLLGEQLLLPRHISRSDLDLFFAPWYTAPLLCDAPKSVVGAWDISYTTHGDHYRFGVKTWLSNVSRYVCQRADGVMTCSPFDGQQIEKYYRVPHDKICVLSLAADDKFSPDDDPERREAFRQKYDLPRRFVLSLGVIYNRRNIDVIINAFRQLGDNYPDIGLVVVGENRTHPWIDIERLIRPLVEKGRALYLPKVSEDDLVELYRAAWYYICTSTVDGETIMLKEAMRCGTPVITSPFLKDSISGHGVIINDPTSIEETLKAFRYVFENPHLRQRYAKDGCRWVHTLSWDMAAESALEFLETR